MTKNDKRIMLLIFDAFQERCLVLEDICVCPFFFFSYIVDHQMHDGLWDEITDTLVDNSHVGIHQIADGFNFTLQLRVHGEVIGGGGGLALNLQGEKKAVVVFFYYTFRKKIHTTTK